MGKDWWKIVFGVLCGLLAGGLILLVSSQPRGEAVRLEALPSPAPLLVHVAGEVANPGVYSLADGSRVQDAIQAAGGASAKADVQAINLAEMLEDGNWVTVPAQAPTETPTSITTGEPAETATPPATPTQAAVFPIDINSATQAELESLPWIGPVRAAEIIAYRTEHGPFSRIEDLLKVYGITREVFDHIKHLITAGNSP